MAHHPPVDLDVFAIDLSTSGVVGFAMRAEYEAAQLYGLAAERCDDPAARAALNGLAGDELGHLQLLSELFRARWPEAYAAALRDTELAPDGEPADAGPLSAMSLGEIYTVAIWEEHKARRRYSEASQQAMARDPELAALLARLADAEQAHATLLIQLREGLPPTP